MLRQLREALGDSRAQLAEQEVQTADAEAVLQYSHQPALESAVGLIAGLVQPQHPLARGEYALPQRLEAAADSPPAQLRQLYRGVSRLLRQLAQKRQRPAAGNLDDRSASPRRGTGQRHKATRRAAHHRAERLERAAGAVCGLCGFAGVIRNLPGVLRGFLRPVRRIARGFLRPVRRIARGLALLLLQIDQLRLHGLQLLGQELHLRVHIAESSCVLKGAEFLDNVIDNCLHVLCILLGGFCFVFPWQQFHS